MTRTEIITYVRNELDELNVDNSHYSDAGGDDRPSITSFIDKVAAIVAGRVPPPLVTHLYDREIKSLEIGRSLYDLPSEWVRTSQIKLYDEPARIYTPDWEPAILNNTLYAPSETRPVVLLPYYDHQCKIFPAAASVLITDGFEHQFIRAPEKCTEASSVPELPLDFHPAICEGALAMALDESGDGRAAARWRRFDLFFGGK